MINFKFDYKQLIVVSAALLAVACSNGDEEEIVYSTEMGQIEAHSNNVYTGQTLSLRAQLPECVSKNKAQIERVSWVAVYGDSIVHKVGTVSDGYCFLNDKMPEMPMECRYTLTVKFSYRGEQSASVSYRVDLRQSDALASVWGETPEETMRNVPIALNHQTNRYEYYEENAYGARNPNSLWSYYYVNNKLFSITHLQRYFNETDSLCFSRFIEAYKGMKESYGRPVEGVDANFIERIISDEKNDSIYRYCMNYYGKCLHSGRIATSDSTSEKFSLNVKFVNKSTLISLFAVRDSVNSQVGGVYYSTEYSYRLK